MVNAQQWLDKEYPKNGICTRETTDNLWNGEEEEQGWNNQSKTRTEITKLDISEQNLEEELDLTDFINLEELDCGNNKLTTLKLNNCSKLKRLWCYDNQLTELAINNLTELILLDCRDNYLQDLKLPSSAKKLTYLTIRNNNITGDLAMFKDLTNLEVLYINTDLRIGDNLDRNNQTKIEKGIYNKFEGSLESLKNLSNLKELNISNTDIDSGLEYLPKDLERFYCSADIKLAGNKKVKVKKIEQALKGKLPSEREKDMKELLDRSRDIQKNIQRFFFSYSNQEVKELKDPRQIEKLKDYFYRTKWAGRGITVTSGILSLTGYSMAGGGIAIGYPLLEAIISEKEKQNVENNESKWEEFVKSSKELWSDYQDLIESLKPLEVWDYSKQWQRIEELKEKQKNNASLNEEEKKELKNKQVQWEKDRNYKLWLLWEKVQKVYERKKGDNPSEANNVVTKDDFARDLWEHWTDDKKKVIIGWVEKDGGRKSQWEEIGERLVEASKNYQGVALAETSQRIKQQQITNHKGKVKEANEYEARIEIPDYGSINKK